MRLSRVGDFRVWPEWDCYAVWSWPVSGKSSAKACTVGVARRCIVEGVEVSFRAAPPLHPARVVFSPYLAKIEASLLYQTWINFCCFKRVWLCQSSDFFFVSLMLRHLIAFPCWGRTSVNGLRNVFVMFYFLVVVLVLYSGPSRMCMCVVCCWFTTLFLFCFVLFVL